MTPISRLRRRAISALVISRLVLAAGTGGMAISLVLLASASYLDVIAGATGLVAGSILAGTGLLSLTALSRVTVARAMRMETSSALSALVPQQIVDRWLAHFRRNRV